MVVFKELIFHSSSFEGCGGLGRTDFLTVSTLGGCGGLELTDFSQFLLQECVVVLKELIFQFRNWGAVVVLKELTFHSFYFGWV